MSVHRTFRTISKYIEQKRSRLWIILVGLYVAPYIFAVIGSVHYPTNNLFVVLAAMATSEGIGSLSYTISKWGQKSKRKRRRKRRTSKRMSSNVSKDVLDRCVT